LTPLFKPLALGGRGSLEIADSFCKDSILLGLLLFSSRISRREEKRREEKRREEKRREEKRREEIQIKKLYLENPPIIEQNNVKQWVGFLNII